MALSERRFARRGSVQPGSQSEEQQLMSSLTRGKPITSLPSRLSGSSESSSGDMLGPTMSAVRMRGRLRNRSTSNESAQKSKSKKSTTLIALAEAGVHIRRHRKNTLESWGRRRAYSESASFFDKYLPPTELFRRAAKLVQMFSSLCQFVYQRDRSAEDATHTVFTQYIQEDEEHHESMNKDLAFDPSFFKANRKMRMSAETKKILSTPALQRSEQQLGKLLFALRNIKSFAEYPLRMQQKMIHVGWYEGHGAKRVILRQGHFPQAFYFILSGSAVVTVVDSSGIARTVAFLKRGDSFGELAILHETSRQSTIITREYMELLVISKEDFIDIFMDSGGIKNINDPDHSQFIRSINFLKGWPLHILAENPRQCVFHFFRRGAVLVKDSNHTGWIYIIKSGSCQVLKKLKQVKSQLTVHHDRVVGFENVNSLVPKPASPIDRVRAKLSVFTLLLPKLNSFHKMSEEVSDDESSVNDDIITTVAQAQKHHLPAPQRVVGVGGQRASIPAMSSQSPRTRASFSTPHRTGNTVPLPRINTKATGVLEGSKATSFQATSRSRSNTQNSQDSKKSKKRHSIKPRAARSNSAATRDEDSDEEKEPFFVENKISVLDDEEEKYREPEVATEADMNPLFVQVCLLSKGDVFGVAPILFDGQPSLSLVSNGAECIMISKKLFLANCTEALKRRLMLEETPYPDEEALQKKLQDKTNWDEYKKQTLKGIVEKLPPSPKRPYNGDHFFPSDKKIRTEGRSPR